MSAAELEPIRRVLADARKTAALWRADRSDLAARSADLADAIAELREARKPLTAYARRGSRWARHISIDPAHALNREVTRELKRLSDLRRRTVGKPEASATGTARPKRGGVGKRSMHGTLNYVKGEYRAICREREGEDLATLKRPAGKFDALEAQQELREEAAKLLARLESARHTLNATWRSYQRESKRRLEAAQKATSERAEMPFAIIDEREEFHADVVELRERIRELRAALKADTEHTVKVRAIPPRKPGERWELGHIADAWQRFRREHGRLPTKADHATTDYLPAYTQLRRTVGKDPARFMVNFLDHDAGNEEGSSGNHRGHRVPARAVS